MTSTLTATELESVRGDTYPILVTAEYYDVATAAWLVLNLAGAALRFTAKALATDADADAVVVAAIDGAGASSGTDGSGIVIVDAANGVARITITAAATVSLAAPVRLVYDIQAQESDGRVSTLAYGAWLLLADASRTAP